MLFMYFEGDWTQVKSGRSKQLIVDGQSGRPRKIYERNPKVSYLGLKDMSHRPKRPSTIVQDRSL